MISKIFLRDDFGRIYFHGEVVKDIDRRYRILIQQRDNAPAMSPVEATRTAHWLLRAAKEVELGNSRIAMRRIGMRKGKKKRGR